MHVLLLPVAVPYGSAASPAGRPDPEVGALRTPVDDTTRAQLGATIWEKLERCVAVLPEPFTRQEILSWFRRHEPDVREQSLGQHIQMATAGKATGVYARRTPLLERLGHGLYRPYRGAEDPS